MPSTRSEFWGKKLDGNKRRDRENRKKLRERRWNSLVVWECETKPAKMKYLKKKIAIFLNT